jgi:hypothetical protein
MGVEHTFSPDQTATQQHLEHLFRRCQDECPDTTLQLDRSEVDGKAWVSHQFPTTITGMTQGLQWAMDWNSAGWNIYVGANPRKFGLDPNKSATDKDIYCAFFSFGDLDSEESLEIAKAGMPINNTYSTNTGTQPWRRCHLYWEHEHPVYNLEAWRQTQVGIANYFKGDSVIDPRRILRLAGCVNYPTAKKRERGYIAEIATIQFEFDGEERAPVDTVHLHTTYAGTPASAAPENGSSIGGLGLPGSYSGADVQQLLADIMAGNEWHNNVVKLTAHWVARGWSDAEIRLSCLAFTLPGYTQDATVQEVMKAVAGARDKWDYANPTYEVGPDTNTIPDTKPKPSKQIKVIPFDDMKIDISVNDFVEGLLGTSQMSVIYGDSNSGKTFFILDLAFYVSMGWKWRGLHIEQGGVIYCALEGKHGINNRCLALKAHYQDRIGEDIVPLGIVTEHIDMLSKDGDTDALIAAIKDEATRLGIDNITMIVIDTLARALSGGNENSSEDMGALVMHGDEIRAATGAHVLFVHHSGKDKAMGARGHSSLRAATDTEIEVSPGEDTSCAEVTKQREYESGQHYTFSLTQTILGTDVRGKDITSCIVHPEETPINVPKKKKITGKNQKLVMKALANALSKEGTQKLNDPYPPLPFVREEALRTAAFRMLSGESKHRATRFTEALNALVNDEHCHKDGDRIWVC